MILKYFFSFVYNNFLTAPQKARVPTIAVLTVELYFPENYDKKVLYEIINLKILTIVAVIMNCEDKMRLNLTETCHCNVGATV